MQPITKYTLAKIGLARVACPAELADRMENRSIYAPIILEKNRKGFGAVAAVGFTPKVVVVAGAERRRQLLERGIVSSWGWVERGAMEIKADDAIGTAELTELLQQKLLDKLYGPGRTEPAAWQPWPYIIEVYPFENYLIYHLKAQKYRQAFFLNPVERKVAFVGNSVPVEQKFVNAAYVASIPIKSDVAAENAAVLPRVETGLRYATAPVHHAVAFTRGAAHSELFTQVVRNWSNIEAAVRGYLEAIRNGLHKPMRPAFYPVVLTDGGQIAGRLAAVGVEIADFVRWTDQQQKRVTGVRRM